MHNGWKEMKKAVGGPRHLRVRRRGGRRSPAGFGGENPQPGPRFRFLYKRCGTRIMVGSSQFTKCSKSSLGRVSSKPKEILHCLQK